MASGSLVGTIAVIKRGGCFLIDKVLNAEAAGAVAAVVVNYDGDNTTAAMIGGDGKPDPNIPSAFVGPDVGAALLDAANVSAAAWLGVRQIVRDGSLDAGVIYHEYGHGLTRRWVVGAGCGRPHPRWRALACANAHDEPGMRV